MFRGKRRVPQTAVPFLAVEMSGPAMKLGLIHLSLPFSVLEGGIVMTLA
jgi:hypothetical protein